MVLKRSKKGLNTGCSFNVNFPFARALAHSQYWGVPDQETSENLLCQRTPNTFHRSIVGYPSKSAETWRTAQDMISELPDVLGDDIEIELSKDENVPRSLSKRKSWKLIESVRDNIHILGIYSNYEVTVEERKRTGNRVKTECTSSHDVNWESFFDSPSEENAKTAGKRGKRKPVSTKEMRKDARRKEAMQKRSIRDAQRKESNHKQGKSIITNTKNETEGVNPLQLRYEVYNPETVCAKTMSKGKSIKTDYFKDKSKNKGSRNNSNLSLRTYCRKWMHFNGDDWAEEYDCDWSDEEVAMDTSDMGKELLDTRLAKEKQDKTALTKLQKVRHSEAVDSNTKPKDIPKKQTSQNNKIPSNISVGDQSTDKMEDNTILCNGGKGSKKCSADDDLCNNGGGETRVSGDLDVRLYDENHNTTSNDGHMSDHKPVTNMPQETGENILERKHKKAAGEERINAVELKIQESDSLPNKTGETDGKGRKYEDRITEMEKKGSGNLVKSKGENENMAGEHPLRSPQPSPPLLQRRRLSQTGSQLSPLPHQNTLVSLPDNTVDSAPPSNKLPDLQVKKDDRNQRYYRRWLVKQRREEEKKEEIKKVKKKQEDYKRGIELRLNQNGYIDERETLLNLSVTGKQCTTFERQTNHIRRQIQVPSTGTALKSQISLNTHVAFRQPDRDWRLGTLGSHNTSKSLPARLPPIQSLKAPRPPPAPPPRSVARNRGVLTKSDNFLNQKR